MFNYAELSDILRDERVRQATRVMNVDFVLSGKERGALALLVYLGINAVGRWPNCPAYKMGRNKAYRMLAERGYSWKKGEWTK